MFNIPNVFGSGFPPVPFGVGSTDFGPVFIVQWANTSDSLPIQIGYDATGGTTYTILPIGLLSNGSRTIGFNKTTDPFPATNPGTSYAFRYISSGYIGNWSLNTIPY